MHGHMNIKFMSHITRRMSFDAYTKEIFSVQLWLLVFMFVFEDLSLKEGDAMSLGE